MSLADAPTRPIPRIDPRMARRVVEVEQQRRRYRRRLVGALCAVTALGGVATATAYSPLLEVRHVRVEGAGRTVSAVLAVSGLGEHPPMVSVDGVGVERHVESIPMVAGVSVSRQWPSTVRLVIRLRIPVAVVRTAAGAEVVDRTGRVLSVTAAVAPGLPVLQLTGSVPAGPPGSWVSPTGEEAGLLSAELALAAALPPVLVGDVGSIAGGTGTVTAVIGDTTVRFASGPAAALGAQTAALEAVVASTASAAAAASVPASLPADVLPPGTLDLTVPDRPVLTPPPAAPPG